MKRLEAILIGAVAAAVALGPSVAWAQYSTPLRYDLRYTSPTYIPSGTLRTGPPRQADPYRFGNPLHGNLAVTGNLRLGKSFQGNTPYVQTGSQLAESLPSTRLSNFRRDSFGVGDLGTPLQYGQTEAYYPDSATVTTPWTAGHRFDDRRFGDRAGYLPPNFNTAAAAPLQAPGNIFTGSGGWTGLTAESLQAAEAAGYVPEGAESTTEVLESLRAMTTEVLQGEGAERAEGEEAALLYPYAIFEKQFRTEPMNLFGVEPARRTKGEESPYERTMNLRYAPETTDLDRWVHPMPQEEDFADEPLEPVEEAPAAADRWGTGGGWADPDAPDPDDPWAAFETADPLSDVEGLPAARTRPVPVPREPTSGYGHYVLRGHEALRQGQYGKAESLYAAAAALERNRPAAFFGRVHALLAGRLYLQAAAVLKRGLASHPEWATKIPDLEAVYPDKDVFGRIHRELKREVDRGSAQAGYRFLLAYAEFSRDNAAEARSHLPEAANATEAEKALLEAMGPG
ncbi:MAG: hypothetical protein R6X20_06565 [Phycisphaerae bacterium]